MPNPDPDSISWLRVLLASVSVLGLMALLGWGLKYLAQRGWIKPGGPDGRLKLLASLPLDARRRVVVVKCDDQEHTLLLGPQNDLLLSSRPSPTPNGDAP